MTTTLALDENLISQAQKIGHHKTKKDAVTTALKEYIARKKQIVIVELFG
ncbi:MAG: type II toxin-antitoxin system VapB family antitoxin, partial [Planctomycetota bacterium]